MFVRTTIIILLSLFLFSSVAQAKPVRVLNARARRTASVELRKTVKYTRLPPSVAAVLPKVEVPPPIVRDPMAAGIGVNLIDIYTSHIVEDVAQGSPAAKAGLQPGDSIVAVNGKQTGSLQLYEVKNLLRGKKGSKVQVAYLRREQQQIVSITLDTINEDGMRLYEWEKIPIVKIFDFTPFVDANLRGMLLPVAKKEPKAIIVDVRNNAGGSEASLGKFMSLFLRKGSTYARIDYVNPKRTAAGEAYTEYKVTENEPVFGPTTNVILLINRHSYGISEMIAADLRESGRGFVVGEATQGVVTLASGANGEFLGTFVTPEGKVVTKVGVQPDVSVSDDQEISDLVFLKGLQLVK